MAKTNKQSSLAKKALLTAVMTGTIATASLGTSYAKTAKEDLVNVPAIEMTTEKETVEEVATKKKDSEDTETQVEVDSETKVTEDTVEESVEEENKEVNALIEDKTTKTDVENVDIGGGF